MITYEILLDEVLSAYYSNICLLTADFIEGDSNDAT
jgi:hypothetical protein